MRQAPDDSGISGKSRIDVTYHIYEETVPGILSFSFFSFLIYVEHIYKFEDIIELVFPRMPEIGLQ